MKPRSKWWLGHRHAFAYRHLTELEKKKLGLFVGPTYTDIIEIRVGECGCGQTGQPVMCWADTGKALNNWSISFGVEKGYLRRTQ
jgi:hypothetical protein